MEWTDFARILDRERLPAALVDLDALDRNVDRLRRQVAPSGKTLRVATKSIRHVGLTRRIMERGEDVFRGLMCFTHEEAAFLARQGFDDLLVAYPSLNRPGLNEVAAAVAEGRTIRVMADHEVHLEGYGEVARAHGVTLDLVIDLDVSYRPLGGKLHVGVQRSPVRSAARVAELARAAERIEGVRVVGLMGYEAHIAGLPDENPFSRALNPGKKALKRLAVPKVAELRGEAVRALADTGVEIALVNGGGTGSVRSTIEEPWITEVTAGSGFLTPHLFDYYEHNVLEPAGFFAVEVSRVPGPGLVTCLGAGYVASGEAGPDKLPLPYSPRGLELLKMEGAGEVQTPLRVPLGTDLSIGDPVIFRHAKAGELAERFETYLLVQGGETVGREPTYRGMGRCFL